MRTVIKARDLKTGDRVRLAPQSWGPAEILTEPKKYESYLYITYKRLGTGACGNSYIAPDMEIEVA